MKNLYIEYRSWIFFWGLALDSQKAVQKNLDKYNKEGWKLKELQFSNATQTGIVNLIIYTFVSFITLGFVSYYAGFYMIFEKPENANAQTVLDKPAQLKNLKELLDKGSISQNEFDKQKQQIMSL